MLKIECVSRGTTFSARLWSSFLARWLPFIQYAVPWGPRNAFYWLIGKEERERQRTDPQPREMHSTVFAPLRQMTYKQIMLRGTSFNYMSERECWKWHVWIPKPFDISISMPRAIATLATATMTTTTTTFFLFPDRQCWDCLIFRSSADSLTHSLPPASLLCFLSSGSYTPPIP